MVKGERGKDLNVSLLSNTQKHFKLNPATPSSQLTQDIQIRLPLPNKLLNYQNIYTLKTLPNREISIEHTVPTDVIRKKMWP